METEGVFELSQEISTLQKHLQSVHQWYRNDESLASHGSYMRQLVSVACAEALPLLVAKEDCELLFMLTLQLMFCQEAGFFSQSREVCGDLMSLLLVLENLVHVCGVYMCLDFKCSTEYSAGMYYNLQPV